MADGIFRRVRLFLDRRSAEAVEKGTKDALDRGTDPRTPTRNLGRVSGAMDKVRGVAVRLGAAIAAAFAIRGIARFAREAIRASQELEKSRNTLRNILELEGAAWERVGGEVESVTRRLWETHRLTEGEVNPILQSLILTTGDYARSLSNVGLAADLAAATGMDAARAAQYLGRILNGETTVLRRYGITIQEGRDGAEQLREMVGGMAREAAPWSVVMRKAWGDFMEQVGLTIQAGTEAESVVGRITDSIRGMTAWLEENREAFSRWGGRIVGVVQTVVSATVRTFRLVRGVVEDAASAAAVAWQRFQIGFLEIQRRIRIALGRTTEEIDQQLTDATTHLIHLMRAQREMRMEAAQAALAVGAVADEYERAAAAVTVLTRRQRELLAALRAGGPDTGLAGVPGAPQIGGDRVRQRRAQRDHELARLMGERWMEQNRALVDAAQAAARGVASAWEDAFSAMLIGGESVAAALEGLFRGVGAAGLGALAQYASEKVAVNVAEAIEQFARSLGWSFLNPAQAAASQASAKQHLAAAAAWAAIGGASGAAQTAVARGGRAGQAGGLPRGANDPAGRLADGFGRGGPEIHLHIDGVDPSNPRHQATVGRTMREWERRYGVRVKVDA
jgi:hypothetical protein